MLSLFNIPSGDAPRLIQRQTHRKNLETKRFLRRFLLSFSFFRYSSESFADQTETVALSERFDVINRFSTQFENGISEQRSDSRKSTKQ